jgi:hypothetical protein
MNSSGSQTGGVESIVSVSATPVSHRKHNAALLNELLKSLKRNMRIICWPLIEANLIF